LEGRSPQLQRLPDPGGIYPGNPSFILLCLQMCQRLLLPPTDHVSQAVPLLCEGKCSSTSAASHHIIRGRKTQKALGTGHLGPGALTPLCTVFLPWIIFPWGKPRDLKQFPGREITA